MNKIARIIDKHTIHVYDKTQFNWEQIMNSGQVFITPSCAVVEQADKIVITATGERDSKWLWNYFDFDTDYNIIKAELAQFAELHAPIMAGGGIRILRQDFYDVVVGFICSTANRIPRIKNMMGRLCEKFGGRFPHINELLKITRAEYDEMRFGMYGRKLIESLPIVAGLCVGELGKMTDEKLRVELFGIKNIGPKVCACIMLFAGDFHRLSCVPEDTWIRRAQVNGLNFSKYGKYAGVAQQYVFYYIQHLKGKL